MQTNTIGVFRLSAAALVAAAGLVGCKSGDKGASGLPGVKVNPAQVQAMAENPAPPPTASKRTSIGSGTAAVNTSNAPGDTDSFWVAEIDVDGDGDVEETQLLWDDEDRVLFAYAESAVPCDQGGTALAAILIGANGRDNPRGRPAGSGFYAVYLDATECGAQNAGLFGCRFDAQGNETQCGAIIVNAASDDITFVSASEGY